MRSLSGWLAGITLGLAGVAVGRALEADPTPPHSQTSFPAVVSTAFASSASATAATTTTATFSWVKDPKLAAQLASEQGKLVLTFFTLGDLCTGHC